MIIPRDWQLEVDVVGGLQTELTFAFHLADRLRESYIFQLDISSDRWIICALALYKPCEVPIYPGTYLPWPHPQGRVDKLG